MSDSVQQGPNEGPNEKERQDAPETSGPSPTKKAILSTSYPHEAMRLAKKLNEAELLAGRDAWNVVIIAHKLRQQFPDRAKKGAAGWEEFCKTILNRRPNDVWREYMVANYCDKHADGWRSLRSEDLPPVHLVRALAMCDENPKRETNHDLLFGRKYESVEDFLHALEDAKELDGNKHKDKDKDKDKKGKKDTHLGTATIVSPSALPEPTEPSLAPTAALPAPEASKSKIIETPEHNPVIIHVTSWATASEIIEQLNSQITDNIHAISKRGACIMVIRKIEQVQG